MEAENVRLLVWDLDDTFWKGTVSEGGIREYVQAHHDIVIELARRGIPSSICSKNDQATILEILQQKGIQDYFVFPSISWEPKGMRLAHLVEQIQLRPSSVMFIDDNPSNRAEAAAVVPGLQVEDEKFIPGILADPRFKGKDDAHLTRLQQYKLLERRKRDESLTNGNNEDFLRGCDVRVFIEHDVEMHIDRAIELINRTNQLNFTKKRLPEEQEAARRVLREQLKPFDRVAGLVCVADKYGDYGFVGFFMTGGMRSSVIPGAANTHLIHYCFSCRTLGMLVESWIYEFIGRPELKVVGEVLTDLSVRRTLDWVRQVQTIENHTQQHEKIAPQIVLYGGCEVNAMSVYLQSYTEKLDAYGNYVSNGLFVRTNFAARLIDVCDRDARTVEAELECLGLPLHLETGDIFASAAAGAVFVVNFSMDAGGGDRLRHRTSDWTFVLEPHGLDRWETLYVSSAAELEKLLESSRVPYTCNEKRRLLRVSKHLQENYEREVAPSESEIVELMETIIARVPKGSKLVIIADHDQRQHPESGEIQTIPRISSYRALVNEIAAGYSYVATVSVSDAIESAEEMLGANHYSREVYLRLSRNIVGVARALEPRSDDPLSKRRIARLAAERAARFGRMADAREFVQASYEVLLRRGPEPGIVDRLAPSLAGGRASIANHIRGMSRSQEFTRKWRAIDQTEAVDRTRQIESIALRVPDELSVTKVAPQRVLIVGSCLSERFKWHMTQLPNPCESDLYFVGNELPSAPERPIGDYNFQLIQLALRHILPDSAFARLSHSDKAGHERLFNHVVQGMRRHFEQAMRWNREHGLLTFVLPFIVPMQNPVGRLLARYDLSNPTYFIEQLNEALAREMARYENVHLLDLNEILSFYGRRFFQDDLTTGFSHGSFISDFDAEYDGNRLEPAGKATDFFEERVTEIFLAAWRELSGLYRGVRQIDQVKLVVVDLDDTMWRGVFADHDVNNLPNSNGWPVGFWEALLTLKRRGILLAIISKNEESPVLEAWDKIFGRQLSLEDFAVRKINWIPKPQNMSAILAHVNLLPSSVVYIDDNPVERAAMKGAFPDMRVLGGSPLMWRRVLLWSSETQVATITSESVGRTEMVRAQVTREEHRQTVSNEEFLASLQVKMTLFPVKDVGHPRFPRVFELINKTNQFNTTGRRWTREECAVALASGTTFYAFEVADRYTEYGLVGVLIVDSARIVQFVMSCRIMGLEAEIAAVSRIGALLRNGGGSTVLASMVETERNQPCRNLYSRCGFEATAGGWQRSLNDWFRVPEHIVLCVVDWEDEATLA